jgi:tetratricopeptide (TPR) repeat protein/tRNA A-37 threonylcarbamoyl transferase component Bud32
MSDASPVEEDDEEFLSYLTPSSRPDSLGRIGHYEVLEVLGKGAFGIVFRAFDDVLYRVVAIKVLAAEVAATAQARKRFLREARSSAAVRHENVVLVHSVEETPLPFLVMEFIPGETLQQKLERVGALEVPEVVEIGRQIAEGLAAAHATGLIHRDIKPGNVLLESGMPRVKITDFGLARAADDASISHSGLIAGTPMYMAPEQALGQALDQRADLFSLGSVLYHMVAGRPPFAAKSTLAVLKHVTQDSPRPIRESMPETPLWLCDLIARLHAKNPDDRFQSAREVADLLAQRSAELRHVDPSETAARVRSFEPKRQPPSPAPGDPTARKGWRLGWAAAAVLALVCGGLALTEASGVTHFGGAVLRLVRRDPVTVARNSRPVVRGSREAPPPRPGQETRAEQVANAAPTGARALLERQLSAQPGDAAAAAKLADLLLRDDNVRWTVLTPAEMKAEGGATLTRLEDNSILVSGPNPAQDRYTVTFRNLPGAIHGLRLEVLTDKSLPQNGPGRCGVHGDFFLTTLAAELDTPSIARGVHRLKLARAVADFSQNGHGVDGAIDSSNSTSWAISPETSKPHFALFEPAEPVTGTDGAVLRVTFEFQSRFVQHGLGRFRLSVAGVRTDLDRERQRLAATAITDPWQKLAAVYRLEGDQPAIDKLVERDPGLAGPIGDLFNQAVGRDAERAVAIYNRGITAGRTNVNLLTKRARAYEALKQWDAAAADWSRAAAGSPEGARWLAEFARRLAAGGQGPLASGPYEQAQALYERALAADPGNDQLAGELAQLLLDRQDREDTAPWTVLKPAEMKTETGAELELQKDGSIFAHQRQPFNDDTYSLVFSIGSKRITGLRLEVLADSRLPYGGPGWGANGNFLLNEVTLEAAPAEHPDQARVIALRDPRADFSQATSGNWDVRGAVDGNGSTGWAVYPRLNQNHTAVFELTNDGIDGQASRLTVRLNHRYLDQNPNLGNLGRFRLSVSGDPAALARELKRFAATRLTNPWAKLAAAYDAIGQPQAAERVIAQHPEAPRGTSDRNAAAVDWEAAITARRKALAADPTDLSLLTPLATAYQAAGRTREAVPHLAAAYSADPKNTLLSLTVAALQAWFGQDQELADTCRKGLAIAEDTKDVFVADRVAKICSLRSTDDKQHEAALILARRAVELGKGHPALPFFQMALGMAEYRSGHFVEADAALTAAMDAGKGISAIAGTSAFYRAMSLFRMGKPEEARTLASAAAAKMMPLPADEQNPLAGGANVDHLILWLAYKEAKAMIHFDAAPAVGAPRDPR